MATKIKQWEDGSLSITYNGSGDGEAIFTSDTYEGIDRTMPITFKADSLFVERIVRQEGIRQRFVTSDGKVFCGKEGRFGVLRSVEEMTIPLGVSIVTSDGNFIPHESYDNNATPIGVCVKDDRIGAIILDLDAKNVKWTSENITIDGIPTSTSTSTLSSYMDGKAYTALLLEKNSSDTYAAGYAVSRKVIISGVEYVGYIASLGEWAVLMEYDNDIVTAFATIGKNFIGTATSRNFWTSVQYDASKAWRFAFNANGGFTKFSSNGKTSFSYVRAVYKYE